MKNFKTSREANDKLAKRTRVAIGNSSDDRKMSNMKMGMKKGFGHFVMVPAARKKINKTAHK